MSALECDERTISDALDVMAHGRATSDRSRLVRDYAVGRVRYNLRAREVYSYGDHFPLLRFVPRGRRRPLIVLNGDRWPGSNSRTSDHQAIARRLGAELGDTIVIPFSALEGAGIDMDSIRPLAVRADAIWRETVARRPADTPLWRREDVSYEGNERRVTPVPPDADGFYRWEQSQHRLGDCVFSAVRREVFTRPARPFEASSSSARAIIEVAWRDSYCNGRDSGGHETGPGGACVYCGKALEARVTVLRRARYLSSFDYQERAPLYFLAQLPRGAAVDSVDMAIEALAPRAVHAARARGIPVERQGDVFFIRTSLEASELEARGIASRARLTQWSRDARARKGEVGYVPGLDAAARRRMLEYQRAEWRRMFADAVAKISAPMPAESYEARIARKVERAREWRAMQSRHAAMRAAAAAAGLERFKRRESFRAPGPWTDSGARKRWAKIRADHADELARARRDLRAAAFGLAPKWRRAVGAGPGRREYVSNPNGYRQYRESQLEADRRAAAEHARTMRRALESLEARGAIDSNGNHSRAQGRDSYRARYKAPVARAAWGLAGAGAAARFIPHESDGGAIAARREKVRRALAIYGTAHSASEVIRARSGATYARGTVRHVRALEGNGDGPADHRPLELGSDWWLAVRNTVPRQRSRRAV